MAELGNELHRLSARAHQLAVELDDGEADLEAVAEKRVHLKGCDEHTEWQPSCPECYELWVDSRGDRSRQ